MDGLHRVCQADIEYLSLEAWIPRQAADALTARLEGYLAFPFEAAAQKFFQGQSNGVSPE